MKFGIPDIVKKPNDANRTLSPFARACVLSLLAHLFLFLSCAYLIFLFGSPNFDKSPLIFDVVYKPADEQFQSGPAVLTLDDELQGSQQLASKIEAPDIAKATEVREGHSQETPIKSPALEPSAPPGSEPGQAEVSEPNYVPDVAMPMTPRQIDLATVEPAPIVRQLEATQPSRIPAKIAMTSRQREMLFKEFRKWSENLDRLELQDSTFVWEHSGESYTATFRRQSGQSEVGLEELVVEISTNDDGYRLSTEMRMKRLAFSNFAQFVDYWDPRVAVHDDVLDGRFHSNSKINISASRGITPEFRGKVTTASHEIETRDSPFVNQQSVFLGGLETGVKEIRLPKKFLPFVSDSTLKSDRVHLIYVETYFVFHPDGSYTWYSKDRPDEEYRRSMNRETCYILCVTKKKIHVKGVVRGNVLLYSSGDIIIEDDLTYARNPFQPGAEDYLGLVSDRNIEVAGPDATGPGDLQVYASIYAKGRFRVQDIFTRNEGTLYIYGSLAAGSLSATEPRYATRVEFDKRLEKARPPSFPMTDRYEVTEWNEHWEVKTQ